LVKANLPYGAPPPPPKKTRQTKNTQAEKLELIAETCLVCLPSFAHRQAHKACIQKEAAIFPQHHQQLQAMEPIPRPFWVTEALVFTRREGTGKWD
jgi:hypothetical protein